MSPINYWALLVGLSALPLSAYEWTVPSNISTDYHPGIKHARGVLEDFDLVQDHQIYFPQVDSDESEFQMNLGQENGLASQAYQAHLVYRHGPWNIQLLSEWRQIRSDQGVSQGLSDPWVAIGYENLGYQAQLWYKAPFSTSNDVNNPNMSQGASTYGATLGKSLIRSEHFMLVQVGYFINGTGEWGVSSRGNLLNRKVNEGQWSFIQLTHQYSLTPSLRLSQTFASLSQWNARFELGDFQSDLSDYHALKYQNALRKSWDNYGVEIGLDLTLFENIDTPFSGEIQTRFVYQWGGVKNKVKPKEDLKPQQKTTKIPMDTSAVIPKSKEPFIESLEHAQPSNDEQPVIYFTLEEPTLEEKIEIEKAKKAREIKRMKKLQEELKKQKQEKLQKKILEKTKQAPESKRKKAAPQ